METGAVKRRGHSSGSRFIRAPGI